MEISAILNLGESVIKAQGFEVFFDGLKTIRKEKPEQFINAIISFARKSSVAEEVTYLFHRLELTGEELILLVQTAWIISTPKEKIEGFIIFQDFCFYLAETGKIGTVEFHQLEPAKKKEILKNLKLTSDEISVICRGLDQQSILDEPLLPSIQWKISGFQTAGFTSLTPEPSGDELLKVALQKVLDEKKFKKPSEFKRFVDSRIEKTFNKKAKPYTDEQLTEGAEWYNATRKEIAAKKTMTDQRSRSRVNLPQKIWEAFLLKLFKRRRPEFAVQYRKAVRDEAAKISKRQNAQSSSK